MCSLFEEKFDEKITLDANALSLFVNAIHQYLDKYSSFFERNSSKEKICSLLYDKIRRQNKVLAIMASEKR